MRVLACVLLVAGCLQSKAPPASTASDAQASNTQTGTLATATDQTPHKRESSERETRSALAGTELEALMTDATKAYDRLDFDEARSHASKVLEHQPTNVRMLRIILSSYCIEGDAAEAQKYFDRLPARDREQMKARCGRYGVTFAEPPSK